ncbi:MAG: hypothetical protein NC342_08805 [Pseudoflavonifractor sp.]|nr:hypothetical protein [Alloprevotella sp.]MCM1117620.1 hypothetical protein [Pseudoflavonifractor sp.]
MRTDENGKKVYNKPNWLGWTVAGAYVGLVLWWALCVVIPATPAGQLRDASLAFLTVTGLMWLLGLMGEDGPLQNAWRTLQRESRRL